MRCLFSLTGTTTVKDRTVQGDVRGYLLRYQDEKGKARLAGSDDSVRLRKLTPDRFVSPSLPTPEGGLGRVILPPGYHRGRLTAAGFLKDQLVLSSSGFEQFGRHSPELFVSKAKWVGQVAHLWAVNLAKYKDNGKAGKKVRYNFFLSLDAQTTKEMTDRGLSAPVLLEQVLQRTVKRYQEVEGYDPKDRLGYVYGFHFDRAHLHVHIAFLPRTEMGKELRFHDRDRRMLNAKGEKVNHLKQLTVMACEEAESLLKEMGSKSRIPEMDRKERTQHIFRSSKVVAEHQHGSNYPLFEKSLVERFRQSDSVLSVQELLDIFRSYVGLSPDERKEPELPKKMSDIPSRRLYRLWLADTYERSENEERHEAERKKRTMGPSAPGLPVSLVPYYDRFWRNLEQQSVEDLSDRISRLAANKLKAAARDIQQGILPVLREVLPAGHSMAELRFITHLDKLLLLGQTVFFSQATLSELEYAVYLRVSDIATLRELLPIADAEAVTPKVRDLEEEIEGPEEGPEKDLDAGQPSVPHGR